VTAIRGFRAQKRKGRFPDSMAVQLLVYLPHVWKRRLDISRLASRFNPRPSCYVRLLLNRAQSQLQQFGQVDE